VGAGVELRSGSSDYYCSTGRDPWGGSTLARLDYALLAEFARVDHGGLLTVVGGGFTQVNVTSLPAQRQLYVAMRLLLAANEDGAEVTFTVRPPDGRYKINLAGAVERPVNASAIKGEIGVMLATGVGVPLPVDGRYEVQITVNGESSSQLPFVVHVLSTLPDA